MLKVLENATETEEASATVTLDELAREGARRMLRAALAVEVAARIESFRMRHVQFRAVGVPHDNRTVAHRAGMFFDVRFDLD